jgi:hypothetical protein
LSPNAFVVFFGEVVFFFGITAGFFVATSCVGSFDGDRSRFFIPEIAFLSKS